jgi:hypothetical protein
VVANGDVFIVRQERVVRSKQLAHVGGMEDGRVEVGVIADGHPDGWLRTPEDAERQILNREIGAGLVRRRDPTLEARIVCRVHDGPARKRFFKPCQHS